jgi:hypothetical protein
MDLAAVERAYGELLAAFGDLVVAETRGEPVHPADGSIVTLRRRYRARRRTVEAALAGLPVSDEATDPDDARALEVMRGVLPWFDEIEPPPARRGGSIADAPTDSVAVGESRARAALYRRFGRAAASIEFGDERLDRLTVLGRLGTEPDPAVRQALFRSLESVWRAVDGGGRAKSPLQRLAPPVVERWRIAGSPIEANAQSLGLAPGSLDGMLREMLSTWRDVMGPGRMEPWDYWYALGGAPRRLNVRIPQSALMAINASYLRSLGADPDSLGISYDVIPRPGRPVVPGAFTIGMGAWAEDQPMSGPWTPRPPWVFATYATGGLGNLLELLHESGHALHAAATRARPGLLELPVDDTAYAEGMADFLGWDATEPAWQRRWLGDAAEPRSAVLDRYGGVMLDVCWALFELELYREPDQRPNDIWTRITTDGLGIEPHPEWSWWAMRGQLIDSPGYLANYALSAVIAAALRARLLELRGPWWDGDPDWFPFVAGRLFQPGASRPPAALLEAFLGRPLTVEPLLADLRRGVADESAADAAADAEAPRAAGQSARNA